MMEQSERAVGKLQGKRTCDFPFGDFDRSEQLSAREHVTRGTWACPACFRGGASRSRLGLARDEVAGESNW